MVVSGGLSFKAEIVLKSSLDSIPSPLPSVKILIMSGKVCFEVIMQKIAGCCQQTFCLQMFVDKARQCFAFTPQANFPTNILNFH